MAKQVSELFIKLGIQGEQELSKLKSSFRDLEKVTGLSEQSISNVRTKLLQFAQQAGNTESVANALVSAFKGLRAQTEYCSTAYTELTDDINRFTGVLRGSTDAVERQRQSLLSNAAASRQNAKALQEQVTALERLRDQTRPGSSAFLQLDKDIEVARANLGRFRSEAAAFNSTLTQPPGASLEITARQISTLQKNMQRLNYTTAEYLKGLERISLISVARDIPLGRQQVRATAQMYAGSMYQGAYVRGRALQLPLPNTEAGIQQRVSEIQAELPNVDIRNYLRRRDLTKELIDLNRQLRNAVVDVRTAEQYAVDAVKQRVSASRELVGLSGFGEFSRDVRQATPAGAVERSVERKRRRLAQRGELLPSDQQTIEELATNYASTLQQQEQVTKASYQRLLEYRERLSQRLIEIQDRESEELIASRKAADDALLASFDRRLAHADVLATRTNVLKNMLGFGGRDLSEFYQGVVGIGTQRQAAAQQLMGRSPQQALGDIFQMLSISQGRTGEGTVDAKQALAQSAIEYSGRSRAVQQAFAAFAPGQAPGGLYPRTGESSQAYVRRVEASMERGTTTALARLRNGVELFTSKLSRVGSELTAGRTGAPLTQLNTVIKNLRDKIDRIDKLTEGVDPKDVRQSLKTMRDRLERTSQRLEEFGRSLTGGPDAATTAEQRRLRQEAIRFSGGAPAVIEAFRGMRAGNIPTSMFPSAGESQTEYVSRLGVGATAEQFKLPKIPELRKNTILELQATRERLQYELAALEPTAANYEALERRYRKTNDAVDRELSRRERGGRRLSGMQFAQTAGAVISGGIFGGPEGFLGGAVGGALGGVGGAFAGAAIGGQFSIVRQQLAGMADYAAQLDKLRISLKGITTSNKEYQQALAATTYASARFNLLPTEATQSFTRLAASVKGAGGSIKDAEIAFNAITSAIKATGGSAADVDAAILAVSQVFSKGKVSAEELSGQIGERLPGAVTLFAQATGRTLPGLQKDLKDGVVGLNDFMKFVVAAGEKYTPLMDKLAGSTQNAGERMQVSLANLRAAFGRELGPIGAGIQNTTSLILDLALKAARAIKLVKEASGAEVSVLRQRDLQSRVGEAYRAVSRQGTQGLLPFTQDPRQTAFASINAALRSVTAQSGLEGTRQNVAALKDLAQVQRGLTIGNNVPQDVAQRRADLLLRQGQQIQKRLQEEEARLKRLQQAEKSLITQFTAPTGTDTAAAKARDKALRDAQVAAEQQQRLDETIVQNQTRLADKFFEHATELDRRRYELQKELDDLRNENQLRGLQGIDKEVTAAFLKYTQRLKEIDQRVMAADVSVRQAQQQQTSAALVEQVTSAGLQGRYRQGGYGPSGPRTYGAHFDIKRVGGGYFERNALDQFVEVNGRPLSAGVTVSGGEFYARRKGRPYHGGWDYQFGGDTTSATLGLRGGARWMSTRPGSYGAEAVFMTPDGKTYKIIHGTFEPAAPGGRQRAAVAAQGLRAVREGVDAQLAGIEVQTRQQQAAMERDQAERLRLEARITFTHDLTEALTQQNYQLNEERVLLQERTRLEKLGVSNEYLEKQLKLVEIERRRSQYTERITALIKEAASPAERALFTDNLATINTLLNDQANILDKIYRLNESNKQGFGFREGAKQYVESLGSMKEATSQLTLNGIKGLEDALMDLATTGSANFASFAAEVLKQGARMILQQLVLKPLIQGLANLFNPGAAAASSFSAFSPAALNFGPMGPGISAFSANGNVFASNGIVPYAMGGIVNTPTLFRFANGGVPSTGLMGEAGPEAIIPLRRGSDGKLGVAGGGSTSITINVDAKGSSAEGDPGRAAALGRVITAAVQAELVKQKRPGGLLSR
jgi:lambda family phage tail tape measure protein